MRIVSLFSRYQKCGCVNPFIWTIRSVVLPGTSKVINASLCDVANLCYYEAAKEFLTIPSILSSSCEACPEKCSTVDFTVRLSSLSTPASYLLPGIKQFVESSSIPLPANWSTTWSSEIQANYVALEVFCESTRIESFTQQATLTAVDMLSNVGGQTGLWIGISFLSLMEITEMVYRLIRYQCHHMREKIRKRRTKTETRL